jgi:DNA (cytosine-5)-methyltransferase 1
MPTFGSLFAGIGGLDLGLERAGWTCRWQVERDPFCVRVLEKHWPDVARYGDIVALDPERLEAVDLICGGFPCQPVSVAGKRLAQADARWLWPEFSRIVRALRPRLVLVENVPGLLDGGIGDVLGDLATCGFDAEWECLSAAALGAPHERDRVWLVATNTDALDGGARVGVFTDHEATLRASQDRNRASVWLAPAHVPARVGHGSACWVDRRLRTEAVGNSVVPQVAEWIGLRLMQALPVFALALTLTGCAALGEAFLQTGVMIQCGPMPTGPSSCVSAAAPPTAWVLWSQAFGADPEFVEVYAAGSPHVDGDTAQALCQRTAWALTEPGENLRYFCRPDVPIPTCPAALTRDAEVADRLGCRLDGGTR